MLASTQPLRIFYSYSHIDEELRDELEKYLVVLRRQGTIASWHDRRIGAGEEWKREINDHINTADIILLLVSADFLASDYAYEIELSRAMERHESGEARVIPIILRPCDWEEAPFGMLQALPKGAKPITSWEDSDEAFLSVARGIRQAVKELLEGQTRTRDLSPDDFAPKGFLELRISEGYHFFLDYQQNPPASEHFGSEWLAEKYREVITHYLTVYLSLCRRQHLPAVREILDIAGNFKGVAAQLKAITSTDPSDIYTSLSGSRVIRVGVSQMFKLADFLTRPESVKAKKLYEAITNPIKMRRALNRGHSIPIGELGYLRPVITITERYDRFWTPALPDFRLPASGALSFSPYELSLSPQVQKLRSKFDSVLEAALPGQSASILNSQISGRLRIYPPGTGVIQLGITLEFKEAVHIETVAQIARNVEELVFVDAAGLEKPYYQLMLEIVDQVSERLFKNQGIPYGERRWLPPTTTYVLHDQGLIPENNVDKLAYLLSLAPANQQDLRDLEKQVERAIRLPQWNRDRVFAVAAQGVGLFFIADSFAKGRRSKKDNLQGWLAETHELVSAAAYAQQAFAEEVDRLYSQRALNKTWLESDDKFNYLLSLLETMRQVMQAIVSIRVHLKNQGTGALMTLAKDIWASSNPVDKARFESGLTYIAEWLARSQATSPGDRVSHLLEVISDIQQIKPPFSVDADYLYRQTGSSLHAKIERQLLKQLQEIEQILRGGKALELEQIAERFQVVQQLRNQLGL